jgi:hypothetical protein
VKLAAPARGAGAAPLISAAKERDRQAAEDIETIVSIEETIPGTALDQRLRREQTEAILQLLAAHSSRVHRVDGTERRRAIDLVAWGRNDTHA